MSLKKLQEGPGMRHIFHAHSGTFTVGLIPSKPSTWLQPFAVVEMSLSLSPKSDKTTLASLQNLKIWYA